MSDFFLLLTTCRSAMIFPNFWAHLYWISCYRLVAISLDCHCLDADRAHLVV